MQQEHTTAFGEWDGYSTAKLVKVCDQFNECQLFRTLVGREECRSLSDVGCATGRFYRFFHHVWPSLEHKGFDISEKAIEQAKKLHPKADFRVFDGRLKSAPGIESDIVVCRDVVHHQTNPCEFLSDLYDIARRHLILRIRTREVGATVFDVSQSCQYAYGHWVPYIVINTSEVIELVRSFKPAPAKITLKRHPVVLGGKEGRFLPKELYYPETGTAEMALLIEKRARDGGGDTLVTVETHPEVLRWERWRQCLKDLARWWGL